MPMFDFTCEVCGSAGREWRYAEQGPPRFCSRACQGKGVWRQRKPHKWVITPEKHELIRRTYQGDTGNGQIRDLAKRLGLPRWKVTHYAINQGFTAKMCKAPDWTEKEIHILERHAHKTPDVIARHLKANGFSRSAGGCLLKRKRMRFLQNLNGYSATKLAECFGIDPKSLTRAIVLGKLPAEKRGTDRTPQQGGDMWWIKEGDIRHYILNYLPEIDFRKVDKYWLVDVLVNCEVQGSTLNPP